MNLTRPAKTLAILSGCFLLILPIMGLILSQVLLSTYEIGNVTYEFSPPYFWLIFALNYIFGITILAMSLNDNPLTHTKGVFFLIFGILVATLNFAQSIMLVGILLVLARILVLLAFSGPEANDSSIYDRIQQSGRR